jgi:O-antigen/teichoic acid export membrane protein
VSGERRQKTKAICATQPFNRPPPRYVAVKGTRELLQRNSQVTFNDLRKNFSGAWIYAISTTSMLVNVAAQAFAILIVARYLGKSNYGKLTTLTALIAVCAPWVQFGTAELMRRRVALNLRQYPQILGHCLIMLFFLGSLATFAVSLILTFFVHFGNGGVGDFLVIWLFALCGLVLYPWMVLVEQVFLAHDLLSRANLTSAGFGAWRTVTALLACAGFGAHSVSAWAAWNFGAFATASIAGAFAIARFGAPVFTILKDEIGIGATFGVSGFLNSLRGNVDILSLSLVATPETLGSYGLARKIVSVAIVTSASLDRLIYSKLVRASQKGLRYAALVAIKFAFYAVVITASTAMALYIVAPYLIPKLFGVSYSDAIPYIRVFCPIIVIIAMQNLAYDTLNSANLHKIQVAISSFCVLAGAASVVILTKLFAISGAISSVYILETLLAIGLWLGLGVLAHPNFFQRSALFPSRERTVPRA